MPVLAVSGRISPLKTAPAGFELPLSTASLHPASKGLVPDKTCTPAELAASRIDVPAWLQSLKPRVRHIAEFLAAGQTTTAAASKFKVSAGRISQLRRELARSWQRFVGDDFGPATAA
jgi:hypothetical protein